jgi:dephospho-CoA kinase
MLSGGTLNRARLRQRVFDHPDERRWLEALLHPLIYRELERQVNESVSPYCLLVIPLILETGHRDFVDRLLVVDCLPETQRRRLQVRDGLDETAMDRILSAQFSREQRLSAADDVIVNEGPIQSLRRLIERLHRDYLALAGLQSHHSGK